MKSEPKKKAYAAAGVDIDLANRVKLGLQQKVRTTFGPEVLGKIGDSVVCSERISPG